MTLSELVPSLDLCQQLRAAGFSQDTAMVWMTVEIGEHNPMPPVVTINPRMESMYPIVAAPTAEEILRVLPVRIDIGEKEACLESFVSTMNDFFFYVGWQAYHISPEKEDPWYGANKLFEAAAHAYLWWKREVAG